ncbi:unnamed protein product [Parnassius apollo]|uniref:(apollo) hypothetical protein n=1 Tax=Parnassius apollo TaxID=110799 RepID=A0A8S3XME2_PARAO|nr:unnamed protein product [Parnassius apollo]
MNNVILSICVCALLYRPTASDHVGPIGEFLRTNLVGQPVIHEKQTWVFDPEVAKRRRKQFIALHGDKGEKLIERLGLGIDGYDEERLQFQRERDEGHLGGLNAFLP